MQSEESTTELLHVSEMQRDDDIASQLSPTPSGEMTVDQLIGQIEKVQDAMRRAMREGEHYGVIPGTSSKPTLLKPGAEKLCLLFRLSPTYQITRREMDGGHVEYEVVCELRNIATGSLVAQGVGLCSSMENKYRWRKGSHECTSCGASAIIKGKEEYGGGWLCWKKKGGCGAKFGDSEFSSDDLKPVENPDLADVFNTVLKMSKKRAHVDATLTATAASDIFTQDIEDMSAPRKPAPANEAQEIVAERPVQTADHITQQYWRAVVDGNITKKVGAEILKESRGDFREAMKEVERRSN